MELPTKSIAWPPADIKPALDDMAVHNAWYVGDVDKLTASYGGNETIGAGGVVGLAKRFWYGRPITNQTVPRLHVPVASDIASLSADLLYSEPPMMVFPDAHKTQTRTETTLDPESGEESSEEITERVTSPEQEFLEELVNTPTNHAEWLAAAEVGAALGGSFLRLVWDDDISDKVMVQAVHGDNAIPEFRFGRLVSVLFWQVVQKTPTVTWRHLERHSKGLIEHGLYKGTDSELGVVVPLSEHPATEYLVDQINSEGVGIETGVEGLTAVYIPNMLPQRKFRNTPHLTHCGRSDFDGIEALFDAIDETYNSWMRDIRLAKARLVVGAGALKNNGPGQGQTFNPDQEVYEELDLPGSLADNKLMEAHQFKIRWMEHQETIKDLTNAALRGAGYSSSTFGEDSGEVQETATKVKSKERLTERTRDKKTNYHKAALGPFVRTWMQLNSKLYNTPWTEDIPEVRFASESQIDLESLARTAEMLRGANAASTETLVRMVHPEWDGEMVSEEVQKINDEKPVPVDPFAIGAPPEDEEQTPPGQDDD